MINDVHTANGKTIVDLLHDFKSEFAHFVETRMQLFQEEMRQKGTAIRAALPLVIVGAVFLLTAWFLITGLIVAVVATFVAGAMPDSPWIYPIALGSVAVLYLIIGAALAMAGKSALKKHGLKPEKTIRVLQEDKVWLQQETSRIQA